jgi:hypothetical protein
VVEQTILFNPEASEVQAELAKFVKVKLYTDRDAEPYLSNKKLMLETYKSNVLPTYIFLTPEGKEIRRLPKRLSVTPSKREFLDAFRETLRRTTGRGPDTGSETADR